MNAGKRRSRRGRVGLALLLLVTASCSLLPFRKTPAQIEIVTGSGSLTLPALENQVLRYADSYVTAVAHASDEAAEAKETQKARIDALKWKLSQAQSAYVDATQDNPVLSALDIVVLAAVSRMIVEDGGAGEALGAATPLLEAHRNLEASAWSLVDQFLKPDQQQELRNLIQDWRKQNPHERSVVAARFRDFALTLGRAPQPGRGKPTSIFSLLYIDPFAGLNPTTVAIEQSKDLAARVVAYAERMPTLLRWEAELLALELAAQPESQQLLTDASRVSQSAEGISKTVQGVPELVETQRKAAIDQLLAGVAAEREAILETMASREATFRELLAQIQATLNAGGDMSTSLNTTIRSLDAFVRYVSPPQSPASASGKPGKPFEVSEYGKAATDVGAMARDLNALLLSADRTAPRVTAMSQQAGDDLKKVVDHAFWRALILILTLLIGSVPARLAYRALARRRGGGEPTRET